MLFMFICQVEWLLKNLGTPKPYSPLEYRGPFDAIDTSVPGLQYSSIMKNMAKVANKITTIHSMTHGESRTRTRNS